MKSPNRQMLWGLTLMVMVVVWAIVSGASRSFYPISVPVLALYGATSSWNWPVQVYQFLVDLIPSLIFMIGAYWIVYYSTDWRTRGAPLLVALTITLLAYALLQFAFPS